MSVSIQSYGCCPVVVYQCLVLSHTRCNRRPTWSERWPGTASEMCLLLLPAYHIGSNVCELATLYEPTSFIVDYDRLYSALFLLFVLLCDKHMGTLHLFINALVSGLCGSNFKSTVFNLILQNRGFDTLKLFSSECHITSLMTSQNWFRQCICAVRQYPITRTNVDHDRSCHMVSLDPSESMASINNIKGNKNSRSPLNFSTDKTNSDSFAFGFGDKIPQSR